MAVSSARCSWRMRYSQHAELQSPLSPPLARADLAAELRLDHRDEVLSAERAPVGAEGLEPVERRLLVERQFQEIGEARRSLQRRADLDQRVVADARAALKMGARSTTARLEETRPAGRKPD